MARRLGIFGILIGPPGVVLRSLVQPDQPDALSTGTAVAALAAYAVVCIAVIGTVMSRRDVTG